MIVFIFAKGVTVNKKTRKEIIDFVKNIWPNAEIDITISKGEYVINISKENASPEMSLITLLRLGQFFNTTNIDESTFKYEGCDTCDYGGTYELELSIKPEKNVENLKTLWSFDATTN